MAANDNTIERLVDLTMTLLNAPQGLTLDQIINELPNYPNSSPSASRQQFERDKVALRKRGVEIEVIESGSANDYRYRIDPATYYLPDLDLTDRELAALDLALAAVAVNGVSEVDGLSKIGLGNVTSASPVMDVDVSPYSPVLYQGIFMEAETRFDYSGVKRRVYPIALRFLLGHWYLEAYDTADKVAKNFRVDRIESEPSIGPRGSGVVPAGVADSGRILSVPSAVDEDEATETLVLDVDEGPLGHLERPEVERAAERKEGQRKPGETQHLSDMLDAPRRRAPEDEGDGGDQRALGAPAAVAEIEQHAKAAERQHAEQHAVGELEGRRRAKQRRHQIGRREDQGLRVGDLRRACENVRRPERTFTPVQALREKLQLSVGVSFRIPRDRHDSREPWPADRHHGEGEKADGPKPGCAGARRRGIERLRHGSSSVISPHPTKLQLAQCLVQQDAPSWCFSPAGIMDRRPTGVGDA